LAKERRSRMRHLTPDEFVDLAEGARDDASTPHLDVCDVCREQLADLRAMIAVGPAALRSVPEPSPLFWDHLSARVHGAVDGEELPVRASRFDRWWLPLAAPRLAIGAVACALIVAIVAAFGSRVVAPGTRTPVAPPPSAQPVEIVQNGQIAPPALLGSPDDPSLSLVADYGRTLDWDELREQMAVSAHTGGMDATAGDLNGEERQELQRLLKEELARGRSRTDRS
jgi:hypothetical protein